MTHPNQVPRFDDPVKICSSYPGQDSRIGFEQKFVDRAAATPELLVIKQAAHVRNRIDMLLEVTAHELAHRWLYLQGCKTRVSRRYGTTSMGGSEDQTNWHMRQVQAAFNADRKRLLAEWSKEPAARDAKPKPSPVERRAVKAQADLDLWQRKLKSASSNRECGTTREQRPPRVVNDRGLTSMAKSKQKKQPKQHTDAEIKRLSEEVLKRQGNVFSNSQELFGERDTSDLFERLESVGEVFRCDECSIWQTTDMKDPDYNNTCCGCANVNEHN